VSKSYWNYRVLTDGENYWIGEVYYDESGEPDAHTGPLSDPLNYDRFEDLTTTVRLMAFALEKPILRVGQHGYSVDYSVKPPIPVEL
jgi:hypothetical protein